VPKKDFLSAVYYIWVQLGAILSLPNWAYLGVCSGMSDNALNTEKNWLGLFEQSLGVS
jgi:hypothetical protein